jgi:hypothetical protein
MANDQGLQLKAFSSTTPSMLVLQALPLGQLTKLDLNFGSREPLLAAGECRADKLQQFTAVMAQMTNLSSLSLQLVTEARAGAETLLQGVTTLGNLTELQLAPLGAEPGRLQPPVSLRRLAIACDVPANVAPLRLAHLTQLTELDRIQEPASSHIQLLQRISCQPACRSWLLRISAAAHRWLG